MDIEKLETKLLNQISEGVITELQAGVVRALRKLHIDDPYYKGVPTRMLPADRTIERDGVDATAATIKYFLDMERYALAA